MTLKISRKGVFLAGAAVVALGMGANTGAYAADAKLVSSSNDKTSVKLHGHFARRMIYLDDGFQNRVHHRDEANSESRMLIDATGKVNADLSVGSRMEMGMDSASNSLSQATLGGDSNAFRMRKAEIHFTHKGFGRVWIGRGDTATKNLILGNTHGVYSALNNGLGIHGGNAQFRNSAGQALSGVTLGAAFASNSGTRQGRIRYDTPVFAGLMGSVSHSDRQEVEGALRYKGTILDTKVIGGLGYDHQIGRQGYTAIASGKHSTGFGATYSYFYGEIDNTRDLQQHSIQVFYGKKFSELGETTLLGEYMYSHNAAASGDTGHAYSVMLFQKVDAAALELYAKYINFELNRDGSEFDDIDTVTLGTRLKF